MWVVNFVQYIQIHTRTQTERQTRHELLNYPVYTRYVLHPVTTHIIWIIITWCNSIHIQSCLWLPQQHIHTKVNTYYTTHVSYYLTQTEYALGWYEHPHVHYITKTSPESHFTAQKETMLSIRSGRLHMHYVNDLIGQLVYLATNQWPDSQPITALAQYTECHTMTSVGIELTYTGLVRTPTYTT